MGKRLEDIDHNFKNDQTNNTGTVFFDCLTPPFAIYGLYDAKTHKPYCRLSAELCKNPKVSDGIKELMFHTSGGRVCFRTNSPYVEVRVVLNDPTFLPHMSAPAAMGVDLYFKLEGINGMPSFSTSFIPRLEPNGCTYSGICRFDSGKSMIREITLYLPLYSKVQSIHVGLAENSSLLPPIPYREPKPVCFYGSSITQGACSSRPGNSYPAIISRRLNTDFRNLGFSGSAHGEAEIAQYIADMDISALVMEYDYNAASEQELIDTHYAFYRTIRQKQPELPIIMMSAPVTVPARGRVKEKRMEMSRLIIMESYVKAKRNGDDHVYFCDGEGILTTPDALLDCVHPTDLGMRAIADRVEPYLRYILYDKLK